MCLGGPPRPQPLPPPRPTAPPPERTAKNVVTGKKRKTVGTGMDTAPKRTGVRSLRIAKRPGNTRGGNLNL